MPSEIMDGRIFSIYEAAKQAMPDQNIPAPSCDLCKRQTGYVEFNEEEKFSINWFTEIHDKPKGPFFPLNGKIYVSMSRCLYCESYYYGKCGFKYWIKGQWVAPDYSWHPDGVKLNRRYNQGFDEFNAQNTAPVRESKKDFVRKKMSELDGL